MNATDNDDGYNVRSERQQKRRSDRKFSPNRPATLITASGPIVLAPEDITTERVGWKAFGLASIPAEWVPAFFIIDGNLIQDLGKSPNLQDWISSCLSHLGFRDSTVSVRSSGARETMDERGKLISETCASTDILETTLKLSKALSKRGIEGVHWIVQKHIQPERQGHLSNERHVSREPRDWIAEFEIQGSRPGYTAPIGIRYWRHGGQIANVDLSCTNEPGVTLQLRKVALWATGLTDRVHFEWVWSGTEVWVVQADLAKARLGLNPHSLRPPSIPRISLPSLRAFRLASPRDFVNYSKLRNAKTYQDLGYVMPDFFVMDDAKTIEALVAGEMPLDLREDLRELTRRPLIIRTDGIEIPKEKREMLPRSDGLPTANQAESWLLERFRTEVERIGISKCSLALIAHHFVPSAAAAWALAEPGNRIVRIESLWGVPEGLYWYSHDTFEVDTRDKGLSVDVSDYKWREKLRYKGTFIAPRAGGHWIPCQTARPNDWARSIGRSEWIAEIAKTTRRIAEREGHSVTVMWFIDNDPKTIAHRVLPWYHSKADIGTPKAAPRRKLTTAADFTIRTVEHWIALRSRVQLRNRIERVRLEPEDPELIRNQEFARELAEFAATNNIVVEIAGGVLSHAYYVLQRNGAQVECTDLFGADEDKVEYNKLVRDAIPEVIERKGEAAEVVTLGGEALMAALRRKLVEEAFEALDAKSGGELIGELADLLEVIDNICKSLLIPFEHVAAEKRDKHKRRGGFQRGIMLRRTSTPHSLSPKPTQPTDSTLSMEPPGDRGPIENPNLIPVGRVYRRPDLRTVDRLPEKILTFETELNGLGSTTQSTVFEIPIGNGETRAFSLAVELSRKGGSLWSQARLRLEPSQMVMKLKDAGQMELAFAVEGDAVGSSKK